VNTEELIIRHEGFKKKPYKDTRGVWTIGHGLTYIREEESKYIVKIRISEIRRKMKKYDWFNELNYDRKSVIISMCYQLGMRGMLNFKKTVRLLEEKEYEKASLEMLDSKWALQTPNRAAELAEIIRTGKIM